MFKDLVKFKMGAASSKSDCVASKCGFRIPNATYLKRNENSYLKLGTTVAQPRERQ